MQGEIITIGTELVSGRTLDLNAGYAAGRLTASGLKVIRVTSVGDDQEMVADALKQALASSQFVIVTGGLGSTEDDLTNEIVAKALKRPLCLDQDMLGLIKDHAQIRNRAVTPSLEKMAWVPEGSKMINPHGTACGFYLEESDVAFYFLPGVPDQMRYLIDHFVIPDLLSRCEAHPVMRQRTLKLYGLDEPGIAEVFQSLKGKTGDVVLGFYPHFPENHITLSLRGQDEPSVIGKLEQVEKKIRLLVGDYIFTTGMRSMEGEVAETLRARALTLSVAESCTGGLIGHLITTVSGSSRYFHGGAVVYSNQAKIELLDVSPECIETHGAVSDQTAREMAEGVRRHFHSDLGLSVTGIAGPDGGTREKPVGTVYLGLAAHGFITASRYRFWGDRVQIQGNAAMMALDWVRRYAHGDPFLPGVRTAA